MREYLLVWLLLVGWVFKGGGVFMEDGTIVVAIKLVSGVFTGGGGVFIGEGAVFVVIRLVGRVFRKEGAIWTKTASYMTLWMNIIDISNDTCL